jgi:CDP-paratose 2-epimerase
MKILITGGAGFVGSHVAEYYAKKGDEVVVFDNLSRAELLGYEASNAMYNWNYLKKYENIELTKGDIRNAERIKDATKDVDVILHAAAQTAVTTSLENPRTDFEINALGTFNILEAARLSKNNPCIIFCSTNKVYGDNVNKIPVREKEKRYELADEKYKKGIPEDYPTDLCEHTPYGCSKFTGDIYVQDYAQRNEIDAAVFRMSCIYGTRQFGVEDQGWVAWFTIATLLGEPITIYGDGKQVRDVLYVADLVRACDAFIQKRNEIHHSVYNIGGGVENRMSLLELIDILEDLTGKRSTITFDEWRPSDQKVYISDITKAQGELGWKAESSPKDGVRKLVEWVEENKVLFFLHKEGDK